MKRIQANVLTVVQSNSVAFTYHKFFPKDSVNRRTLPLLHITLYNENTYKLWVAPMHCHSLWDTVYAHTKWSANEPSYCIQKCRKSSYPIHCRVVFVEGMRGCCVRVAFSFPNCQLSTI